MGRVKSAALMTRRMRLEAHPTRAAIRRACGSFDLAPMDTMGTANMPDKTLETTNENTTSIRRAVESKSLSSYELELRRGSRVVTKNRMFIRSTKRTSRPLRVNRSCLVVTKRPRSECFLSTMSPGARPSHSSGMARYLRRIRSLQNRPMTSAHTRSRMRRMAASVAGDVPADEGLSTSDLVSEVGAMLGGGEGGEGGGGNGGGGDGSVAQVMGSTLPGWTQTHAPVPNGPSSHVPALGPEQMSPSTPRGQSAEQSWPKNPGEQVRQAPVPRPPLSHTPWPEQGTDALFEAQVWLQKGPNIPSSSHPLGPHSPESRTHPTLAVCAVGQRQVSSHSGPNLRGGHSHLPEEAEQARGDGQGAVPGEVQLPYSIKMAGDRPARR